MEFDKSLFRRDATPAGRQATGFCENTLNQFAPFIVISKSCFTYEK
jgi:hypothetical protein